VNKITTISYQTIDNNGVVVNTRLYPKLEVTLTLDEPTEKGEGFQDRLTEEERLKLFEIHSTPVKHDEESESRPRGGRGAPRGGRGAPRGGRGAPRGGPRGRGFGAPRGRGFGAPRGRGFGAPRGGPRGRGFGVPRGGLRGAPRGGD